MELEGLLETAIKDSITKYSEMDAGTKESAIMCDNIAKLCHAKLESDRMVAEYDDKSLKILADKQKDELEDKHQKEETKRKRKEFFIKTLVEVGLPIVTILYAIWQNKAALMFEETGYWKSPTGKDMFRQVRPRIKMDV